MFEHVIIIVFQLCLCRLCSNPQGTYCERVPHPFSGRASEHLQRFRQNRVSKRYVLSRHVPSLARHWSILPSRFLFLFTRFSNCRERDKWCRATRAVLYTSALVFRKLDYLNEEQRGMTVMFPGWKQIIRIDIEWYLRCNFDLEAIPSIFAISRPEF